MRLGLGIRPAGELRGAAAMHDESLAVRRLLADNHRVTVGDSRGPFHLRHRPSGCDREVRARRVTAAGGGRIAV